MELKKAMRQSVKGGERINLDVLMADRQAANAQKDLAQAKYNYLLSYLRLKQQAGNLSSQDLETVATYFERDKSFVPPAVVPAKPLALKASEPIAQVSVLANPPSAVLEIPPGFKPQEVPVSATDSTTNLVTAPLE